MIFLKSLILKKLPLFSHFRKKAATGKTGFGYIAANRTANK
jgi:hypothetical protein